MEIQWVTDKNGNDFYPATHQKAVIVDGSKTLDKKLSEMESDISNKANPSSIPTNVSQLTNDSNYQTEAQVKSAVSNEVAKIVADAPENYDTLKEISDWISGHENDASAMNSAIKTNSKAISNHASDTDIHVTTNEKTEWNAKGTYSKPSGGIPKSDLASTVQESLGRADTALQSHQDIGGKVDKVDGKGLSTNDYTTAEKTKLAGIDAGANKTVVDDSLSSTSTNPVQNKVVKAGIDAVRNDFDNLVELGEDITD